MKRYDLQFFAAEENLTKAADIEPAISIDFVSRLNSNIKALQEVLGITNMVPMANGTQIKIYKMTAENTPSQVGEGEPIPLTKITRKLAKTITLTLKKHRKAASAEAIQQDGYENAVNKTDKKLLDLTQKEIKNDFFSLIETGTGTASGTTLQNTMSNVWAKLVKAFEDEEADGIYFISSDDAADYLGNASITTQTAMGLTYIQNFLGLGTVIVSPRVTAGKVIGTAKENLNGAFIPMTSGDLARAFQLTADETGFVGMKHTPKTDNATVETLMMNGVTFYPERLDGVIVGTITPAASPTEPEDTK